MRGFTGFVCGWNTRRKADSSENIYKCGFKNIQVGTLRSNEVTTTRTSLKTEVAFFQFLSRLFLPTYFVECKRTLLKLNSKRPYPSSEREIIFRRCLFTFSIKRKIRHLHVVVVLKRQKKMYKKSVMHVQGCCFAY